ncbi:MAG: tRNA (adenosine(37)-N6)-dimethylallyltransferase MiaA [Clostridia bacterium]|nr:tRNA (adenosine(37)-N6)-dimethylallyltransferase MiaA [Clostridia bacterium]
MKPTILALVGPTGSGKTKTAIAICEVLNAEIVSMDSMQIYRGMDIGTAKPTREELAAAPHHMIDVCDPDQIFTVSMYRDMACKVIDSILSRGKRPLLVGGTGLYLQAISYEISLGEKGADSKLREELNQIAEKPGGAQELHRRLEVVDPQSAKKLHPNDVRRVIRALEIFETSGKAKSEQGNEAFKEGPYHVLVYGLSLPRDQMYARINARVDRMISEGLVQEVETLLSKGISPKPEGGAMQAIGYKEIVSALQGEIPIDQAVALIKQSSRRYAKRQWTWFRHDPRTQWFDWTQYASEQGLIDALIKKIRADLV